MPLTKFCFLLLALLLSVLHPEHAESRKLFSDDSFPSPIGCMNCSLCQTQCHPPAPPPPLSGYPLYGPPPPPSGYPTYAPPPPVNQYPPYGPSPPQVNCSQFPAQYPPPYVFGYQPVVQNYSVNSSPPYFLSVMLMAIFIFALL